MKESELEILWELKYNKVMEKDINKNFRRVGELLNMKAITQNYTSFPMIDIQMT